MLHYCLDSMWKWLLNVGDITGFGLTLHEGITTVKHGQITLSAAVHLDSVDASQLRKFLILLCMHG